MDFTDTWQNGIFWNKEVTDTKKHFFQYDIISKVTEDPKLQDCINFTMKFIGSGFLIGCALSLLTELKGWPILYGAGIGCGLALGYCEEKFMGHPLRRNGNNLNDES